MAYLKIIHDYPPYRLMQDKRGFISKLYGNGHTGVDSVGNQISNPVASLISGNCVASYNASVGNIAAVTSGNVQVLYYHLAQVIRTGAVTAGEQIGVEGNTGALATGKHLHTSIKINGQLVDPLPYLTGEKTLPVMQQSSIQNAQAPAPTKGEIYMIRKVIKALNLRSTRSLAANNLVYRNMPVGTVFLVTDTKTEGGVTWGKVLVTIKGQSYTGWSNIAATWSVEV